MPNESRPEIITVNSETLQAQIRDLLPSQNGFGSELQASNVITPIIDLTGAAEGSGLPLDLQTAIAFGSQTAFTCNNTTTVVANSPGFYRIIGSAAGGTGSGRAKIQMSDGLSTKDVWQAPDNTSGGFVQDVDLIFWLAAGESVSVVSTSAQINFDGSVRQIADSTGTLINPSGYPL